MRSRTLGNGTFPLWVVGKVCHKVLFIRFQAPTMAAVHVQWSCSVHVGHFSSEQAALELIVACGVVLEREWPGPALVFPHPSRAGTISRKLWGHWTMEKEVECKEGGSLYIPSRANGA